MKTLFHRTAVLLLVLAMVLSMLPGVFAAAGSKIYNNGTRDQVCTALSAQANAYYTGSYTYEKLSALSGASETTSSYDATQNNPLYDALNELMSTTQTNYYSYKSLSTDFAYTDSVAGAESGEMSDIWGGRLDTWNGSYFNREHVWPKSRASFKQINGGADRHHLRPASAYINQNVHYHHPYGNTTNGTAYYDEQGNPGGWLDGTYYEPNDNVKGDVARILLYVYVRWQQPNLYSDVVSDNLPEFDKDDNENTGTKVIQSLDVLLQWCEDDPVDTWEMGRNDAAEKIQGNRNVFIDYPELAWLMFSQTIPKMTTPSGIANQQQGGTQTYTVTWNVDGKQTTEEYEEGETPVFQGSTDKPSDGTYSYTFTGWSPALAPVTADVTYTAQYSRTAIQGGSGNYTITWYIDGRAVRETYAKWELPSFKGSTDKADDALYSYVFAGWTPRILPVTADVTYTALYTKVPREADVYTVTWVVDGKQTTEEYEEGETPVFQGSTDKVDDAQYCYLFSGWSPALVPVTADVTYTAQYTRYALTDFSGFTDVTKADWFYAEVNRAAQLGLFNGVGEARFDPEGRVSRAMLVTVLYRLAGEPEVEFKTCFLDVKKGLWYSDAVIWAYEEGITLGTDAAHFSPDAAVTREQTATFLCRYAQWEGYDVSARADLSGFPDEDAVSAYAEDAVSWAVANGLISGSAQNDTNYLLPGGTAIRAQSAAIMVRFFNAFVK